MSTKKELPALKIKGMTIPVPIIQGGMGVGVSLAPLAGAVAKDGGLGIVSSACLDLLASKRRGKKVSIYEAVGLEVANSKTMGDYGLSGVNIMHALTRDYRDSVRGAIDAGADCIICGAGLPIDLPNIQPPKDTALIPIVSSVRALEIICKKWERLGYRPDAIVIEGPLAGGHLGFKFNQIEDENYSLEKLFPQIKSCASKYGDFPIIVAGGIYTYEDIVRWIELGADGVQIGTRFLATHESSATPDYKSAVVACSDDDILVVDPESNPSGSPCKFPFRIIKTCPMFLEAKQQLRQPKCDKGYVLQRDNAGHFTVCMAKDSNERSFCICNGLLSSAGYNPDKERPLYTVGTNASRIHEIIFVHDLMERLKGNVPDD